MATNVCLIQLNRFSSCQGDLLDFFFFFCFFLVCCMSENGETEINLFRTSLLCEKKKRSEVFEGIAHFVKIYITIKANGFHNFLRLCCCFMTVMLCSLNLLSPVSLSCCQLAHRAKMSCQENHQRHRPLMTGLSAGVLAPAPSLCHKARTTWDEQVRRLTESKHTQWTNSRRVVAN